MTGAVPFTNNYQDMSTREGYQFRFNCMRCGNGYESRFKHSVTGFGGRLASIGGSLFGGAIGDRVAEAGYDAQWMRDGMGGSTRDKKLREAVEEVSPLFSQCHRCGQWVCKQICWNADRGMCVTCAPKLDQEMAGMQAEAQRQQLQSRIQQQDWTRGINITDTRTALCPTCGGETGGGKFCSSCGTALAAAPAATRKFCSNCGSQLGNKPFCGECGSSA